MNAIVRVFAVDIECPKCEETIPHPNGSLYWSVDELPESPAEVKCPLCERVLNIKIPKETK